MSLARLKNLEIAKFSYNYITGFDGTGFWNQLPSLLEMHVNDNNITGFVGDWGDIPSLEVLHCGTYESWSSTLLRLRFCDFSS